MKILMTSLIGATLALGLGACNQRTANEASANLDNATDAASNAASMAGAAVSNAFNATTEAVTPTPSGQEFVDKAARSDAFEIAAGKLAAERSASTEVKSFAQEMIKAHTDSTAKIKAAAMKASPAITPNAMLTADQSDKLEELGRLNGADFDKAYINGQVEAHEDALSLMQDFAKNGDVPSLRTAAGEIAPIVQMHLDRARSLQR